MQTLKREPLDLVFDLGERAMRRLPDLVRGLGEQRPACAGRVGADDALDLADEPPQALRLLEAP